MTVPAMEAPKIHAAVRRLNALGLALLYSASSRFRAQCSRSAARMSSMVYPAEITRLTRRNDGKTPTPRIADVLSKVDAEARRLGIDPGVIAAAYRSLVEASIAHEMDEFDRRKGSAA